MSQPTDSASKPNYRVIIIVMLMILIGLSIYMNARANKQAEARVTDVYCERWAEPGDPECL